MSPVALSALLALYAVNAAAQATGTFPAVPLASKHFAYPGGIVSRPFLLENAGLGSAWRLP